MFDSTNAPLDLERVLNLLDARIHPFAVYLFGSAVRGTLRNDSDIDLAFFTDMALTPYEQYLISQEAAELLHRDVDLINLQNVETVSRQTHESDGRVSKHCCTQLPIT